MTKFRGCIDIHNGQVKQIVGGTLSDKDDVSSINKQGEDPSKPSDHDQLKTNYVSNYPSSYYANLYKENEIFGTHVIKLGGGNEESALIALESWPNFLQIGGGININNAEEWIKKGAQKVIITSWLFPNGLFKIERLKELELKIGKDKIVIDLSCRKRKINNENDYEWIVAMNKWQDLTDTKLDLKTLTLIGNYCSEFLIHAADVEGLCQGIDSDLVGKLGEWGNIINIPITYAGGAKSLEDLKTVDKLSNGKVDLTFGSALDIFGGKLVKFNDCVEWNKNH